MKLPRKPLRPCKHAQCPELTEGSYCEKHREEMKYERMKNPYSKLYSTTKWQALRKNLLGKQALCVECMKVKRIRPATIVDHIKPHKGDEELFYAEANLQPLCKSCHDRKTAKEDGRWKRRVYSY